MPREWLRAALMLASAVALSASCGNDSQSGRGGDDDTEDPDDNETGGQAGTDVGSTESGKGGKAAGGTKDPAGGSGGKAGGATGKGGGGSGGKAGAGGNGGKGQAGNKAGGGGSGEAGKAGEASGGAGTTDPAPPDNSPEEGYFVSGDWHGWIWPTLVPKEGTDSTIDAKDFSTVDPAGPWCIQGSVAPSDDYGNSAMVGINLSQDKTPEDAEQKVWTPTSEGLTVNVSNKGGSTLRVQLQDNDDNRWCYTLVGSGGFIPWSDFNTICWESTDPGKAYNKEPISQIMIQVPGGNKNAVEYDYCLNSISDGEGGTTTCTPATGKLTEQYEKRDTTKDCKSYYVVQNNVWGTAGASQTVDFTGTSFTVSAFNGTAATTGAPVSYPSIYVGTNGTGSRNSPLPKLVSSLSSVTTTWAWSGSSGGNYNAAYDVWFDKGTPAEGGAPTGGYLMVWFGKSGQPQPMGSTQWANQTVAGKQWDVWNGENKGIPCISYVAKSNMQSWSNFNLLDFIQDAVKKGVLQDSWNLTAVYAGFEIWSGGQGLKTTDFSVSVK